MIDKYSKIRIPGQEKGPCGGLGGVGGGGCGSSKNASRGVYISINRTVV